MVSNSFVVRSASSFPQSKGCEDPKLLLWANTAVCTCFSAISAVNAGYGAHAAIDASGAFGATEQETAMIRMTHAGVIVADYNAIVGEMLAKNADSLAAQVYAAIGLSHFVSMREISMA
jgi:hypothetical protein